MPRPHLTDYQLRIKHPKEARTWFAIRDRTKNHPKGTKLCERWQHSFADFLKDMGPCPSPKSAYSIDRIDNNGHYEPDNCRWATDTTQQRNRSNNRRLFYKGEELTVAEWSERYGINRFTLMQRVKKGWSMRRALTTPPCKKTSKRGNNRRITFRGETLSLYDWGKRTGICTVTIHLRLKSNWSIEDALTIPPGGKRIQN